MANFIKPNSYISTLINAGADAMRNLYYVEFTGSEIDNNEVVKTGLTVRNKDFSFSGLTHDVDTQTFMTVSIDLPKASISGTKEITLNFRVDANWKVYQYLLTQQAKTMVGNLGFAANDVPDPTKGGFDVNVYALDETINKSEQLDPSEQEKHFTKMYTFKYCWIKSLNGLQFNYNSPTPQTVTAQIGFWDFEDPQNLLEG